MMLKHFCDLFYCPKCKCYFDKLQLNDDQSINGFLPAKYGCLNKCNVIYFSKPNNNYINISIGTYASYILGYDKKDHRYYCNLQIFFSKENLFIDMLMNSYNLDLILISEYNFLFFINKVQEIFKINMNLINNLIFI